MRGERFDSIDDARAKYGDEVGKSIPVRKHYLREFEKSWVKFPYPLVVIVVYLLLGILNGAWAHGAVSVPDYSLVLHGGVTPSGASASRRWCRARIPSRWWPGSAGWRSC